MTKRQWHSGPPPSVGWWPASIVENPKTIRWWDGDVWSIAINPSCDAKIAARYAAIRNLHQAQIKWTERWWE